MKLFDHEFYRSAYPDLKTTFPVNDSIGLANHFYQYGSKENRIPSVNFFNKLYPVFDWQFYVTSNNIKGIDNVATAMVHWHTIGRHTNAIPHPSLRAQTLQETNNKRSLKISDVPGREKYYQDLLFVSCYPKKQWHGVLLMDRISAYLQEHHYVSRVYLDSIFKVDLKPYRYIVLDFLCLNPALTGFDHEYLIKVFSRINKPIIILGHDLHWWSLDTRRSLNGKTNDSYLFFNSSYFNYDISVYKRLNVKHFISLYNNFELDVLKKHLPGTTFYNITHGYFENMYKPSPKVIPNIDLLCYGSITEYIYPLRNRVSKLCTNGSDIKCKVIPNMTTANSKLVVKEHGLCNEINNSWITLATCSKFNYFLRKYIEIGATSSTLICNTTDDIKYYLNNKYIYIDEKYTNEHILSLIKYYLNNKEILVYLSSECNKRINKLNYTSFAKKIKHIYTDIKKDTYKNNKFEYENWQRTLSDINSEEYFYYSTQIDQYNLKLGSNYIGVSNKLYDNNSYINLVRRGNNKYYYSVCKSKKALDNLISDNFRFYKIDKTPIIRQVKVSSSISRFEPEFLSLGFNSYSNKNEPCIFYGIYSREDYNNLLKHNSSKIVVLVGGDITFLQQQSLLHDMCNIKDLYIVAVSKSISQKLRELKIQHSNIPLTGLKPKTHQIMNIKRNNILVYGSFDPETYDITTCLELEKLLPQYKFTYVSVKDHLLTIQKNLNKMEADLNNMRRSREKWRAETSKMKILYTQRDAWSRCKDLSRKEEKVNHYNKQIKSSREKILKMIQYYDNKIDDCVKKINFIKSNIKNLLTKYKFLSSNELLTTLDETFVYLRLTRNDGLGALAVECGQHGIKTINNSIGSYNCIPYNETNQQSKINDIKQLIHQEYNNQNSIDSQLYRERVSNMINNILYKPLEFYTIMYYKNNINYFFDKIYILSLKNSPRRIEMEKKLFQAGISNFTFFDAHDGSNEPFNTDWYNYSKIPFNAQEQSLGRKTIGSSNVLANLISVRDIVIDARGKKYKNILILEDDVYFHDNFCNLFTSYSSKLDESWKLLYLGLQNKWDSTTKFVNGFYNPAPNLCGGWAFGLSQSVYTDVIDECNKKDMPFDCGPLKYLRERYPNNCYCIKDNLCITDVDSSTLRSDVVRTTKSVANQWLWDLSNFTIK